MSLEMHRFEHHAMATHFEVYIAMDDYMEAAGAAKASFDDVDQLERELSRFIPFSDISRINRASAGESIQVGAACMDCLINGRDVWGATGGAFDVTIGPLYQVWRKRDGKVRHPSREEVAEARARCGYQLLDINLELATVTPTVGGMYLDLGAIGKGYALDQMAINLRERQVENALLNAGSSTVLALGKMPGKDGWPVNAGQPEAILLQDQALSGTGFMYKGEHIVDPRKGKMVDASRVLRWSVAPTATMADALSTAFMVMNKREISDFLKLHLELRALL